MAVAKPEVHLSQSTNELATKFQLNGYTHVFADARLSVVYIV